MTEAASLSTTAVGGWYCFPPPFECVYVRGPSNQNVIFERSNAEATTTKMVLNTKKCARCNHKT